MSRDVGLDEETLDVIAPGRRRRIVNLAETVDFVGSEQKMRRNEWVSVGVQRGFAAMSDAFLDGVRAGAMPGLADAIETHALCERLVEQLTARSPVDLR